MLALNNLEFVLANYAGTTHQTSCTLVGIGFIQCLLILDGHRSFLCILGGPCISHGTGCAWLFNFTAMLSLEFFVVLLLFRKQGLCLLLGGCKLLLKDTGHGLLSSSGLFQLCQSCLQLLDFFCLALDAPSSL